MSPLEHQKFTRFAPYAVMVMIALIGGVFFTVLSVQHNQDVRSRASYIPGNYSGTLSSSGNIVNGGVTGDVIGSNNVIQGDVAGCVKGDGNVIGGRVYGTVSGSGNVVAGGVANGSCKDSSYGTTPSANRLSNPGCENGTNYLKGYQATISTTTSYTRSGSYACKVVSSGGSFYDMESTQSYPNPTAGQTYTGSAWVRASSNTGGKVYLALRESGGSASRRTTYGPAVTLTSQWQQVTNTLTVQSSGRTSLDYYIVQDPGYSGQMFYVDDMTFSTATGGSYYPTPTPTQSYYPTPTPTKAYYPTSTPTKAYYPTPTPTKYPTPTPTSYPTPTPTGYYPTPTPTVYVTPTATPTPYAYVTPTPTAALYPTNTPAPTIPYDQGSTAITFNLALHGLGKGGDAANPNGTGNLTPLHPQRTVSVEVYDASNSLVKSVTGTVTYDSGEGLFSGVVALGDTIASGAYTVKVKTDQFLRTLVPGIQTITSGQNLSLPKTALVGGDINSDNQLNILDYNVLMGCYSDLSPAANCAAGDEVKADITDDGAVNQFDYNLFLRELINRGGN